MRIYAVLSNNPTDDNITLSSYQYPWVLASFEATQDPRGSLTYSPALLLDSGAFTVWTQGKTVDRQELIDWSKDVIAHYAPSEVRLFNLDVIPGTPAGSPTIKERLYAAAQSAENAIAIREAGLPIIEVYHRYEPLSVLEAICDRRQPGEIISFGGLVGRAGGTNGKFAHCNPAFAYLRERYTWDGMVPVHGLGISGDARLCSKYPWWSVDSSTWFTMRNFNLHVRADGTFQPRNRETAPRTTKDMIKLFSGRRLDLWLRRSEQLTRLWEERGVRYLDV